MNASKEEAHNAGDEIDRIDDLIDGLVPGDEDRVEIRERLRKVQDFIEAAKRKLPSEAAYAREKKARAK